MAVQRGNSPTVSQAPAPVSGGGSQGQKGPIPWRLATIPRITNLSQQGPFTQVGAGYNQQNLPGGLTGGPGSDGYVAKLTLDVMSRGGTGANGGNGGTAAVYAEDAPYSALANVVLGDPGAAIIGPVNGFDLHIAEMVNRQFVLRANDGITSTTCMGEPLTATTDLSSAAPFIAGDANGNFRFLLDIAIAVSHRSGLGVLGNQAAAVTYQFTNDLAAGTGSATGPLFITAPTAGSGVLPTTTINGSYESFTVPPDSINGVPCQKAPSSFGAIHYINAATLAQAPAAGGPVVHTISGLGRRVRWYAFIIKSAANSSTAPTRANAEANPPSNIQLAFGATIKFNGSYSELRAQMHRWFGYHMPAGVLVFPFNEDGDLGVSDDKGYDWVDTAGTVNNATIQVTYPATGWAAGSTIRRITDEMTFARPTQG